LAPKVLIRKLRDYPEFLQLRHIQREVWKHADADLTPTHQFCVHSRMGAIVLGAFVDGALAGFVYSFPAVLDGVHTQHSHLLAVLPEYQGLGIGKKLKWAQRREVLEQEIGLITWTYDPMQARNANLNLHTLGVRSRTYFPNFYGNVPSLSLGPGIPTDRLLVEWRIGDDEVGSRSRSGKTRSAPRMEGIPAALERAAGSGDGFPMPAPPRLGLKDRVVLVEVPPAVESLRRRPDLIAAWQAGLRRVMRSYFKRGYAAVDFLHGERCYYILTR
jgi:predicted GNAT superfamily acetyltransferase